MGGGGGGWLHSLNQKLVNFSGRTLGFVDSVHIFSISFFFLNYFLIKSWSVFLSALVKIDNFKKSIFVFFRL